MSALFGRITRRTALLLAAPAIIGAATAQAQPLPRVSPLPGLTGLGRLALPGAISPEVCPSGAVSMTSIWNGSDKDSTFATPAGTKRLAQYVNAGATIGNIRSTPALSGKVCFALTPGLVPSSDNDCGGIANGTAGLTSQLGNDNNSIVVFFRAGIIFQNGGTLATLANTNLVGNEFVICVDVPGQRLWASVDAGLWNNNASANPATGAGGLDISALGSTLYIATGNNLAHSSTVVLGIPTCIAVPVGFSVA